MQFIAQLMSTCRNILVLSLPTAQPLVWPALESTNRMIYTRPPARLSYVDIPRMWILPQTIAELGITSPSIQSCGRAIIPPTFWNTEMIAPKQE